MLRYLKSAFFSRPNIPLLRLLPWNALLFVGAVVGGWWMPMIWPFVLVSEAVILATLSTNAGFQRWVDQNELSGAAAEANAEAAEALRASQKHRLAKMDAKIEQTVELYRKSDADLLVAQNNEEALRRLRALFIRLLAAENEQQSGEDATSEESLKRQIAYIETELRNDAMSDALRASKQANLEATQKRLARFLERRDSIGQIESDLTRIETQVDLALEDAKSKNAPREIPAQIDLASSLFSEGAAGTTPSSETTYTSPTSTRQ